VSEIDIEGREILHDVFTKDGTEYRRVPLQILNSHETKAAIARGNLYCNRRTKFGKKLVRLIETAEKYEAERAAAIERSGLGDAMARHWESAYEIEKLAHEASEIELQTMVGCSFKLARSPPTLRSRSRSVTTEVARDNSSGALAQTLTRLSGLTVMIE
jgi:hypothetical protein